MLPIEEDLGKPDVQFGVFELIESPSRRVVLRILPHATRLNARYSICRVAGFFVSGAGCNKPGGN